MLTISYSPTKKYDPDTISEEVWMEGDSCWFKVGSVGRSLEPNIKASRFCEPEPRHFCSRLYLNSILDERMPTSSIYYLPCLDYLKRKEKTFKAGVIV